jgi:hypothetical protein
MPTRRLLIPLAALAACGKLGDDRITPSESATTVVQAGRVMAARREAQPQLDSARANYRRERRRAAAAQLRRAADFERSEADSAVGAGRTALEEAGHELDTLAARVTRGAAGQVRNLDRVYARVHEAEATHHLALARDAWARRDRERTGDQLLMGIDHLERAARDASLQLGAASHRAFDDSRALALALEGEAAVAPARVEDALAAVERELATLHARIRRKP